LTICANRSALHGSHLAAQPVGDKVGTEDRYPLKPGQHGSTFGGNPLACAVARAALRLLVEEGMIENAAVQGARFLDGLRSIRSNTIREVRGRGLMLAVELHPEASAARRYCKALQGRGRYQWTHDSHRPPLVITSDQVDWVLEQIGAVLRHDLS
jgi:ornithine--oxo-acid transaminase